jgi:hypothetical protein
MFEGCDEGGDSTVGFLICMICMHTPVKFQRY